MAFTAKLIGVLTVVSPLNIGLLVLPVPRFDKDDVVLVDPRPEPHPARDATHPLFPVVAAQPNATPTEHIGDDREHLVFVWHPEIVPA
jgi:hypothetical protein